MRKLSSKLYIYRIKTLSLVLHLPKDLIYIPLPDVYLFTIEKLNIKLHQKLVVLLYLVLDWFLSG